MPLNLYNNNVTYPENEIDTSLFVQKLDLSNNYIESNVEEIIGMKNHFKIKNLKDPTNLGDAASNNYVDTLFNDPSLMKNTTHVDCNDKNFDAVRFLKVSSTPTVGEQLTAIYYVDQAIV